MGKEQSGNLGGMIQRDVGDLSDQVVDLAGQPTDALKNTKPLSGEIPDLPGPRDVPEALDLELVKNVYNTFCDRVVEAGLPGPPRWN